MNFKDIAVSALAFMAGVLLTVASQNAPSDTLMQASMLANQTQYSENCEDERAAFDRVAEELSETRDFLQGRSLSPQLDRRYTIALDRLQGCERARGLRPGAFKQDFEIFNPNKGCKKCEQLVVQMQRARALINRGELVERYTAYLAALEKDYEKCQQKYCVAGIEKNYEDYGVGTCTRCAALEDYIGQLHEKARASTDPVEKEALQEELRVAQELQYKECQRLRCESEEKRGGLHRAPAVSAQCGDCAEIADEIAKLRKLHESAEQGDLYYKKVLNTKLRDLYRDRDELGCAYLSCN